MSWQSFPLSLRLRLQFRWLIRRSSNSCSVAGNWNEEAKKEEERRSLHTDTHVYLFFLVVNEDESIHTPFGTSRGNLSPLANKAQRKAWDNEMKKNERGMESGNKKSLVPYIFFSLLLVHGKEMKEQTINAVQQALPRKNLVKHLSTFISPCWWATSARQMDERRSDCDQSKERMTMQGNWVHQSICRFAKTAEVSGGLEISQGLTCHLPRQPLRQGVKDDRCSSFCKKRETKGITAWGADKGLNFLDRLCIAIHPEMLVLRPTLLWLVPTKTHRSSFGKTAR